MSTDNFHHLGQSAVSYCPFAPNSPNSGVGVCQLVTNQVHNALNCLSVPDHDTIWFASNGLPASVPVHRNAPMNHIDYCHQENEKLLMTQRVEHAPIYQGCLVQTPVEQRQYKVPKCRTDNNNVFAGPSGIAVSMQPPTQPLLAQANPSSEQAARRQAYYRQRHHPVQSPSFGFTNEELKNKNRFSATGACGDCTVVRDSKMSLSSAPPSPTAGSVGGSLGSIVSQSNHHIHPALFPAASSVHYSHHQPVIFSSSSKKVSDMSTSSTLSSYSSSSLSSSSSINGVSPRKRRADEDAPHNGAGCRVSSSTSEVTAGVNGVRLCDSSQMTSRDASEQHQHKRSKNDNCAEDDDVVFVSMEPAPKPPQQRLGDVVISSNEVMLSKANPFAAASPSKPAKNVRRAKKGSTKRVGRPPVGRIVSSSPVPASMMSYQQQQPCYYATESESPMFASPMATGERYFLRSTAKKNGTDENNNNNPYAHQEDALPIRYHTRSQQRRKQDNAVPEPTIQVPAEQPISSQQQEKSVVFEDASVPAKTSISASVIRTAPPLVSSDPQQRSSSAFKKIYDIRGIIGVGGGGTVYAGTRKADNVQVAIKQVPKAKVKRWGKLDGRVVPIEFELLHRAAASGNKGVIGMLDWYERRNSYILVMERPQPVIDLFDYLNQHGALPENVARNIFRQIVEAVIHCHDNGVVHRDIKDENVLLNLHTSEAKLIDFGCGTIMKEAAYTEFAGTPEFYPPEWFIERRYMGKRVDAWSLGVLLYTMVEAEVPFQKEKDIVACELRHKRAQTTTSDACRHLIATMLQKDQNKRLTLQEVIAHPWLTGGYAAPRSPPSNPQNGVMSTRELYRNPGGGYIPSTPQSPPKSGTSPGTNPFQAVYHQQDPGFTPMMLGGQGSPVPLQASECIVRS